MRAGLVIMVVALVGSGCRCSPATPTAVTLRVKNGTRDAIYVNDTSGRLGLKVKRDVGGTLFGFDESPCPCLSCDRACGGACSCPDAGAAMIRRVNPEAGFERSWSGVVQVSGFGCGGECLAPDNAPTDERFTLELCFAAQVLGLELGDGGVGPGEFPNVGVTCVTKPFTIAEGTVEIGPARGSDCSTTSECKGADELCLNGSCTVGCPANGYPESSGLRVASITNRGFFTVAPQGERSVATGTGTITSAQYNDTTLTIGLLRRGSANEALTGSVQVTMPTRAGPSLTVGANVAVSVIDASTSSNPGNRAVLVRDAATSQLLFAADVGQLGRVLADGDIAPFTLTDGETPTGCRLDVCGKARFVGLQVKVGTASPTEVETGEVVSLNTPSGTYRFVNAWNGAYANTSCT
ncbi:MAG: hypothetical protein JNG84_15010, partial [Archangium sp.]|nr:hypothetical protein [Archangium sp.]